MSVDPEAMTVNELSQVIFTAEKSIEDATLKLRNLETILDRICNRISQTLSADLVAVQLIQPEDEIIETVYGIGDAKDWAGRIKHYLDDDPSLRDIQADIVQTRNTEIIQGWDSRFDRWVYDEYKHQELVRIFTPILLVDDRDGALSKTWFKHCRIAMTHEEKTDTGFRIVVEQQFGKLPPAAIHCIGTIEVGYKKPTVPITVNQARQLIELVAKLALTIHSAQLPFALRTIAESARKVLQGSSTSLHFLYQPMQHRYLYNVCSGKVGQRFLQSCPPRQDGLGRQAIQEALQDNARKIKFVPNLAEGHHDRTLEQLNPQAWKQGIRAMAVFPLLVNRNQKQGVLYIHFQRAYQLTKLQQEWGLLFAHRASEAIRHAILYEQMRDRTRKLVALHSITQSLVHESDHSNLLRQIAWNTLNVLAADIVTIHECFDFPKFRLPTLAGRFRDEASALKAIDTDDVPFQLIERGRNIYAPITAKHRLFYRSSFTEREKVTSAAGVLLKAGTRIVGVMFINYRRSHHFLKDEIQMIETLASSAAIAITNQRWSSAVQEIDQAIIDTPDSTELLQRIVEEAVRQTNADFGEIRRPDLMTEELVVQARHPKDAQVEQRWERLSVGEGITGLVYKRGKSILADDVQNYPCYRPHFFDVRSELAVPMLDQNRSVLAVLDVQSHQVSAFNQRHVQILQALAAQAVIAIQSAENKEQRVAIERIATLGDFAGSLRHKINGSFGAIKVFIDDILDLIDDNNEPRFNAIKKKSLQMKTSINEVIERAQQLKQWFEEGNQDLVDLAVLISEEIKRLEIPDDITKEIKFSESPLLVSGGRQQLKDVFINLIQNAVEAMKKATEIHQNRLILSITGERVERNNTTWVIITVKDTGIGIAPENHDAIFKLGYSSHSGDRGYGLWWTRAYVMRLGGKIFLESQPNQGAEFTVALPESSPSLPH